MLFRNMVYRIEVSGIIDHYNYSIDFTRGDDRIKSVYAENGHGKTNMLKVLKSLTSRNLREFKAIFSLPFKSVQIETSKGRVRCFKVKDKICTISMIRTGGVLKDRGEGIKIGLEDEILIYDVSLEEINQELEDKGEGEVKGESLFKAEFNDISWTIRDIVGNVVFLGSNRLQNMQTIHDITPYYYNYKNNRKIRNFENPSYFQDISGDVVEGVLRRLAIVLRNEARRITLGEGQSRSRVYYKITKEIIDNNGKMDHPDSISSREIIMNKAADIKDGIDRIGSYGLLNPKEFIAINDMINELVEDEVFDNLYRVLVPYLENLKSQIDAFSDVAYLIDVFVDAVNTMFSGVQIKFNEDNYGEFSIHSRYGPKRDEFDFEEPPNLETDVLSSGEKHLLVILSVVTICSLNSTSLLLIDEPEISLGIPWQKSLTKYFRRILKGQNLQLIFATHSPVILDNYRDIDIVFSENFDLE